MKLKIYQKYYIKCLFIDNKIQNYIESFKNFTDKFTNIEFILTEDDVNKIKSNLGGSVYNLSLEELCISLKRDNKDIIVESYNIKTFYYNKKKK
jgi:hypothetical protein